MLAHLADDPGLIEAFERGSDIHTTTAARVFDVDEAKVDAFQRRFAKVVNYGLAYGMEAYGLGQRLDIPTDQAREILDAYFAAFPNVAGYMKETVRDAKARGYTTTLFGRRRQLPELSSDNFRIRQMGERMAQNAPVQGSAADIFKLAMIDLDRALAAGGFESRMILTVHDELVLEVPLDERETVEPVVTSRDGERHRAARAARRRPRLRHRPGPTRSERAGSEGARRALVQRDRGVPRRGVLGTRTRRVCRRSRPEPNRRSTSSSARSGSHPGTRVLDAGCGPGRHSLALARRGHRRRRRRPARPTSSRWRRRRRTRSASPSTRDSRPAICASSRSPSEFDAVVCLCQGGFGLLGGGDDEGAVLERFATRAAAGRPARGRARSTPTSRCGTWKPATPSMPRGASTTSGRRCATPAATEREFDLWTTCFTPRELMLLARAAGLDVDAVHGVTPGATRAAPPSIDLPEYLLLAHRDREPRARSRPAVFRRGRAVLYP